MGGFSSKIYGGPVERFRILSRNRIIQYLFFAGPRQVWIVPPQATTTQLSSFGVRTIDVEADEDLFVPGYEYHFEDDSVDPPVPYSQIPPGFAGPASEIDPARADASPWLDRLPVVQEFRRKVLKARPGDPRSPPEPGWAGSRRGDAALLVLSPACATRSSPPRPRRLPASRSSRRTATARRASARPSCSFPRRAIRRARRCARRTSRSRRWRRPTA